MQPAQLQGWRKRVVLIVGNFLSDLNSLFYTPVCGDRAGLQQMMILDLVSRGKRFLGGDCKVRGRRNLLLPIWLKAQVLPMATMVSLLFFEYASCTPVSETLLFHMTRRVFPQESSLPTFPRHRSNVTFSSRHSLNTLFKTEQISTKIWYSLSSFFLHFFL